MEKIQFSNQLLQNHAYLKTLALRFTRNIQDAADLHQETLCKALEHIEEYKSGVNLTPWLYVIMRNVFINTYRRNQRRVVVTCSNIGDFLPENKVESSYNFQASYNFISSEIEHLPGKFKVPFKLHLDGYKYHEIAKLLNMPLGTVKSNIHIARQLLQIAIRSN